jgi:hypothetical protein
MSQLSPPPQGGARVFADSKPLFEKSGWKNGLIFNELKISSLEWLVYKKNRRLAAAEPCKAAIFLSLGREMRGVSLPQIHFVMSRIHNSKIFELVQIQKRFSITWYAKDGHIVHVPEAELTNRNEEDTDKPKDGMYSKKRCFNIVCIPSGEIRTVDIDAITEFNGEEVFI